MAARLSRMALAASLLLFTAPIALAEGADDYSLTAEEQRQIDQYTRIADSLTKRAGTIELGNSLATLTIPRDFYFLDSKDAETVLVDLWGNPPDQGVLGMLMPAKYSPLDYESWAVTIDYIDDGYVTDDDADEINYAELLEDMQDEIRDANPDRAAAGFGTLELLGWAEPPHYDAQRKQLYWAKELRFSGEDETTLNYEIRTLGRRGILMMTFIAGAGKLDEINANRDSVLAMAEFNPGNRYADFDPEIDKVAAYGLGAVVAGKLAAKAGFFGALLLILKKFGIYLLIGLAAFGRRLKNLFVSNKPADSP